MGLKEVLKKTFLYTGETQTSEYSKKEETLEKFIQRKPRVDIGNPLQRIKDIKDSTINTFKNSQSNSKNVLSDYTKSLLYEAMHNVVETKVRKGKPLVEAKLLYKRFLEDQVTDEGMYSDVDLEYVKALVRHIKELKTTKAPEELSLNSITDLIANHKYLLNIIEVLDIEAGYSMMNYFCELSYVICGFSYRGKDNKLSSILPIKVPHFYLNINDSTFILLNEVSSLISDESPLQEKKNYIIDKVSPLFLRYVILNEVSIDLLYTLLHMFNKLDKSTLEYDDNYYPISKLDHVDSVQVIQEEVEELSEEYIQAKMFYGIQNDVNPITVLHKESVFSNVYSELADPRNPDVTVEELEEAVSDINKMIETQEFELSPLEFKMFSTIKGRLKMMRGGV